MAFNRIAFVAITLTSSAILACGLAHATTVADYAILGATGAMAAVLLAVLARYN